MFGGGGEESDGNGSSSSGGSSSGSSGGDGSKISWYIKMIKYINFICLISYRIYCHASDIFEDWD